MKLYWLPGLVLLCLLAGCRSQQVAFRFTPSHAVAAEASRVNATVAMPSAAANSQAGNPRETVPAKTARASSGMAAQQPARRPALRPAPAKVLALISRLPAVVRKVAPAATHAENGRPSSLERGALLVGLVSLGTAALLKFFAAASFVTLIEVLLYLATFALALWFVLLLLRASKER